MTIILGMVAVVGRPERQYFTESLTRLGHRGSRLHTLRLPADCTIAAWSRSPHSLLTGEKDRCGRPTRGLLVDGSPQSSGANGDALGSPVDPQDLLLDFERHGARALSHLRGAFSLLSWQGEDLLLARDRLGIKPLYHVQLADSHWFASEIKALMHLPAEINCFPSGHCWQPGTGFTRLPARTSPPSSPGNPAGDLARALDAAVSRAVDEDTGVLLSGGVDSSVIAALAARYRPELPTFVAGLPGTADLEAAATVAEVIGSQHHEATYSLEEIDAVLPEVIYALESFDAYLVRGAVANYFASRMAADHVERVLCGEGADELFAGYTYLEDLAADGRLERELSTLQAEMHNTGLQRVDRINAFHGLASRVPFLDEEVVTLARTCPPECKICPGGQSKAVLREVAAELLPEEIAWRPKQKFAQGTGLEEAMAERFGSRISESEFRRSRELPAGGTLLSREELHYYRVFCEFYDPERVIGCVGRTRGVAAAAA